MSDAELNKAALLIVKLLLRTRDGKIVWKNNNAEKAYAAHLNNDSNNFVSNYSADLDDGITAVLTRDSSQLGFTLLAPPLAGIVPPGRAFAAALAGEDANKVLSISILHSQGKTEDTTPESIIYRDLDELIQLAENPQFISNDLRYLQAMSYLDKLTA